MNYKKNNDGSLAEIPKEILDVIWVNYNPIYQTVKLVKTKFNPQSMPVFSHFKSITVYDFDNNCVFLPKNKKDAMKKFKEIKKILKLVNL